MKQAKVFEAVCVEFGRGSRSIGDQPPKTVQQIPDGSSQIRLHYERGSIRDIPVMVSHSIGDLPDCARKGLGRVLLDRGAQLVGVPLGVHLPRLVLDMAAQWVFQCKQEDRILQGPGLARIRRGRNREPAAGTSGH